MTIAKYLNSVKITASIEFRHFHRYMPFDFLKDITSHTYFFKIIIKSQKKKRNEKSEQNFKQQQTPMIQIQF